MRTNAYSKRTNSFFFRILFTIVATLILLPQFTVRAYAEESTRLRPAHVTALIDSNLWKYDEKNSIKEIREIINFVSDIFKKDFGLSFVLDAIKPFDFFLENDDKKNILEKTSCPRKNKIYFSGFADQPGKTAISNFNKFIALHEIGHMFGAKHFSGSESIMNPTVADNPTFDAEK